MDAIGDAIGQAGYLLSSITYLIFLVLLCVARQATFATKLLMLTVAAIIIASIMALGQLHYSYSLSLVLLVEPIKHLLISSLLLAIKFNISNYMELLKTRSFVYCLSAMLALSMVVWMLFIGMVSAYWVFALLLVANLVPLIGVEQLYRMADQKLRWSLWPLVIAFATQLIFDFVLYSQALLVKQLDFNLWYSRGYVLCICLPFLLLASKRIKHLSSNLFVSREVVFVSSLLMIAGCYLLLLAATGYVIQLIGGQWSEFLSVMFLLIGGLILATLLLTDTFRRKARVFISKHFFTNKYEYREEWLKVTDAIEAAEDDDVFTVAVNVMASSIDAQQGVLVERCAFNMLKSRGSKDFMLSADAEQQLKAILQFCNFAK
ncbi:hypothetical protein [Thalassotalea maritima]|uniref:hypothetical protein n=1 Tax=Thalassotalea maritima TaxID=3242416 RepID=UPI003528AFC4